MNGFLALLYYIFSPIITCPFSTVVVILSVYVWSKTYSRKWDEKCFALHLDLCIQKQEWYRLLTHAITHSLPHHIFINIVVWYGCVSRVEMVYGSLYFIKYCFLFIVLEVLVTISVIRTMASWTRSNNLSLHQQTRQYFPIFNQNRNAHEGGVYASTMLYFTNLKDKIVRTCTRSVNSCRKLWTLYLWPCMLKCTSSAYCNSAYRQGVKYCKYISMRYLGGFGFQTRGHLRTNGHGHNNESMLTASSVDTTSNYYDEDEEEGISLLSMEEGSPRDGGNDDALSPNSNTSNGDDTNLNSASYDDDEEEDDKVDNNSYEHSDDTSTGASVITPAHPLLKEPFIGLSGLNMAWLIFISIQIYGLPAIADEVEDSSDNAVPALTNTTTTGTANMVRLLSYGIGHAVRNGALQPAADGAMDTNPSNTATGVPDINGDAYIDHESSDPMEGYTKYTMTTTPYYILGMVPIYTTIAPLLFMLLMSNRMILPIPNISGLFRYLMSHLIYYMLGILLALDVLNLLPENDWFWTVCFFFDFSLLMVASLWVNKEHILNLLPSWNEDNTIVYHNTSHAPLRSNLPPDISAINNNDVATSTPMCQEDFVFVLPPQMFENRYPRTFPAPLTLYPNSMIRVDIEPYDYNLPSEEHESTDHGLSRQQGVRRRGQGGGSSLSLDDEERLHSGTSGTGESSQKENDMKDDKFSAKSHKKNGRKGIYDDDYEDIPPPGSSDSGSGEYGGDDDDTDDEEDAMFSMDSQHVQLGRGSFMAKDGHIRIGAHNQDDDDDNGDDSFENVDLSPSGKKSKGVKKDRRAGQIAMGDRKIGDGYFDADLNN
jgi:hypothetical protein